MCIRDSLKSKYPNNEYKIAFLTAKTDDQTQMNVLDSGADDFITKPIKPNVLSSRIKAVSYTHLDVYKRQPPYSFK